jgi:prepilin-type N-terminal cleavage/methylation domain-containing protein
MQKNGWKLKKAFTLVELLIVVAILGILAAVIMPTLQGHIQRARESAAKDDLRVLRNAIELYAAQHNGVPPGYPDNDTTQSPDHLTFIWQLALATNESGKIAERGTPGYNFGPYINTYSKNPFNNKWTLNMINNSGDFPAEATGDYAYIYKPATKQIKLDWPGTDSEGVRYYDY